MAGRFADTRARILAAAKHLFREGGYERTTIRAVAAEARINPSIVMRYFRSKTPRQNLGLGAAMVEYFLNRWEGESSGQDMQMSLRAMHDRDSHQKAITNPLVQKA